MGFPSRSIHFSVLVVFWACLCAAPAAAQEEVDDISDSFLLFDDPAMEAVPAEPLPEIAVADSKVAMPAETLRERHTQLEEIVVTANKRAQPILEVPMAVTAFSGDDLERLGVENLRDVAAVTPSFSVMEAGPGVQHLQIRGISSAHGQATAGYQLDNVSLSSFSQTQPDAATFDIAGVEILRGPQGTLYGEGSMGGTVKLLTQKPRLGEWEFIAKGEGFVTDGASPGLEANGVVNVPLGDTLALRAVAGVADLGGFIDQVELGEDDYNRVRKRNGRVRVLWQPSDRWTLGALALVQSIDAGSANAADENYQRFDTTEIGIEDSGRIFSFDLGVEFDGFDAFWNLSHFARANKVIFDARDSIVGEISTSVVPGGGALGALDPLLQNLVRDIIRGSPGGYIVDGESQSSELRLSSNAGGPFMWTAGAYGRRSTQELNLVTDLKLSVPVLGVPVGPGLTLPFIDVVTDTESTSMAVFGQVEYDWTGWLSTAIGARYFRERLDVASVGRAAFVYDVDSQDRLEYSAFTPRFTASLRGVDGLFGFIDRSLFYFSYAEGFRSGGANIQISAEIPPTYDPDTLRAYEIGTKLEMFEGRFVAEFAGYFNQWRDVQVVVVPPGGSGSFTAIQNQGNAEGVGFDWNLLFRPWSRVTLYQSGGYIDTEFVTDSGAKQRGDPIDFVSPLTAAVGASVGFHWPSGFPGAIRVDYSYAAEARYQRGGSYDYRSEPVRMLGARLSLDTENAQFSLYGRNLLDNEGPLDANQPERQARARPPSYGVEMKVTF